MTITFAFLTYYIFSHWTYVPQILSSSNLSFLSYAFIFGCINVAAYAYVVYLLYNKLGAHISYRETLCIILVSRIGLYLPGKIWYASNFYLFSRKLDLSPPVIAQTFGVTNMFFFMTGAVCSLPIVLTFFSYSQQILSIIFIFGLFVILHPKSLNYIVSFLPRLHNLVRDKAYFTKISSQLYARITAYFFALWLITGIRLYFCTRTVTPVDYHDFMAVLAASASSLLLGMLAIFAPAGIGVREGVGVLVLSTIISVETALFVMLISRLLSAITDLGAGLSAFFWLNRSNRRRNVQTTQLFRKEVGVKTVTPSR